VRHADELTRRRALDVYTRSTASDAAKAAGVSRQTVHRWAKEEGVQPGHRTSYRPGLAAYLRYGCRCDECSLAAVPARKAFEDYIYGDSNFEDIATTACVTGERVRQWVDALAGGFERKDDGRYVPVSGMASELRRLIRQEQAAVLEEVNRQKRKALAELDGVTCRTCGRPHDRQRGSGWAMSCSLECMILWKEVRYLNDDYRERIRRAIASWRLRNPDKSSEAQLRHARHVAVGLEPRYVADGGRDGRERWLIPGSRRFEIALRAYREGWPSFHTWHEDIQRQVREHVAGATASAADG
jgi:transposase-like protein/DNA-binding XRE family transcriptional regulator